MITHGATLRAATWIALLVAEISGAAPTAHEQCNWNRTRPVWWLHVPKTGTSTMNALVHAVCPEAPDIRPQKFAESLLASIKKAGCEPRFARLHQQSTPLPNQTAPVSIVSFLRDPLNRTISGYFHGLHNCQQMWKGTKEEHWRDPTSRFSSELRQRAWVDIETATVLEYADCVSGCATRMLTGLTCGWFKEASAEPMTLRGPATPRQKLALEVRILEAVQRVREELAFVGISERWDASTTMMWNFFRTVTPLKAAYLKNVRPSRSSSASRAKVARILADYPFVDAPIYEAAKERYEAHLTACGHGAPHDVRPIRRQIVKLQIKIAAMPAGNRKVQMKQRIVELRKKVYGHASRSTVRAVTARLTARLHALPVPYEPATFAPQIMNL
ncbi:hypothetical protein T492DRAFT_1126765 [Pavlovales sp. CCMP2436]|nr:hypothetical protein T492DRAFT_1126765 [Pavlovales sp. CCMP2436]